MYNHTHHIFIKSTIVHEKYGFPDVSMQLFCRSILQSDVMDMSNCSTLWPLTSYSPIGGTSMFPGVVLLAIL